MPFVTSTAWELVVVVGCTRVHSLEMVMVHKTYKNHTDGHQYGTQYYEFSDDWGGLHHDWQGLRKETTFSFRSSGTYTCCFAWWFVNFFSKPEDKLQLLPRRLFQHAAICVTIVFLSVCNYSYSRWVGCERAILLHKESPSTLHSTLTSHAFIVVMPLPLGYTQFSLALSNLFMCRVPNLTSSKL